jgi:hypothetical protein
VYNVYNLIFKLLLNDPSCKTHAFYKKISKDEQLPLKRIEYFFQTPNIKTFVKFSNLKFYEDAFQQVLKKIL